STRRTLLPGQKPNVSGSTQPESAVAPPRIDVTYWTTESGDVPSLAKPTPSPARSSSWTATGSVVGGPELAGAVPVAVVTGVLVGAAVTGDTVISGSVVGAVGSGYTGSPPVVPGRSAVGDGGVVVATGAVVDAATVATVGAIASSSPLPHAPS